MALTDVLTSVEGCKHVLIGTFDLFGFLLLHELVPLEMVIGQLCVPKSELEEGGCGFLQAIRPLQTALKGVGQGLLQPRLSVKPVTRRIPMAGMTGPPSYNTCTGKNIQKEYIKMIALVAFGRLNSWEFFLTVLCFLNFLLLHAYCFQLIDHPVPSTCPSLYDLRGMSACLSRPVGDITPFKSLSTPPQLGVSLISVCLTVSHSVSPSPSSSHNTQGLWPTPRCPACPAWE